MRRYEFTTFAGWVVYSNTDWLIELGPKPCNFSSRLFSYWDIYHYE